ncbi:MAG: TolC family protein, partial [Deltaproteobacteria bacterium]|nr:TolC family protein [Deltaproteobacteria bacterium]
KQDIVLQVKEAYFRILKVEKIKEVALQAVEQVKSHVDVAQAFFEAEMIPKNDLLEAQVRYAQVKQDLIRADNGVQIAKAYFNTVLRQDVNEPVEVEDILGYRPEVFSLKDCLKEAREERPEMKEANLNLERAQKGVRLAKSRFFPHLSVVTNYQRMGDHADLRGNPYEDAENWMVSTLFSWDVWEWGKNIFVAETAREQAEENSRLNQERYNEQMATTTDVLDAQTLLTEAQNNYYNALSDYHISKARLERAIGRE